MTDFLQRGILLIFVDLSPSLSGIQKHVHIFCKSLCFFCILLYVAIAPVQVIMDSCARRYCRDLLTYA